MPYVKRKPCCARLTSRLLMNRAALANTARRAAGRKARGLSTAYFEAAIVEIKANIAEDEHRILEHEGEHAEGRI